jgi:hydrogenase/urease accessory protein HupE
MAWQVLLLLAFATASWAHQPGLSTLHVQLRTNSLESDLIVAWQELEQVVPMDSNQDGDLSADELAAASSRLQSLADSALQFDADGAPLRRLGTTVQRDTDATGIRMISRWEFAATNVLLITSDILNDLQRGHRQIVSVRGATNALLAETALTRERHMVEVPMAPQAARVETVGAFLWLGIEHILAGWDHLTFLFGLLVVGGCLRDAIKIITAFTIAHSLTLALATFDLIRLPSAFVEAAIAASIVYVGIENMVRHNYKGRWILTFAFGLIHGCGFATILRDLGVGSDGGSVVKPLVWFNIGVELGQLAIAAVVVPWILKLKPKFRWWIPVTSSIVALIGAWFLIERTLL